ncbi:lamin tail domain-containing protein [Verrucomicrobiaceae bacterium 227]
MIHFRNAAVIRPAPFLNPLFLTALTLNLPALEPPTITPESSHIEVPTLLTLGNPNLSGAIFYTTDGTDPRTPQGRVHSSAHIFLDSFDTHDFGGPLAANRSMVIHSRVKSGDDWSELKTSTFQADQDLSMLLVTEIMFHPTDGRPESEDEEFIEFKNIGESALNLSGLRIVDFTQEGSDSYLKYTFPENTIAPPGGFVVVASLPKKFQNLYPDVPFHGGMASKFNNQTGRIALIGPDGSIATQMRYETHYPWPVLPDNHGYFKDSQPKVGFSLTRKSLDPGGDPEHFSSWRTSAARLGSPGSEDSALNVPPLVINEFRSRSDGALVDRVEIYNPTPAEVSLSGWWLSNKRNKPYKYKFPENKIVPAMGYLVVDEVDFCEVGSDLSLSSKGDRCYLFSATPGGELTGYSHGTRYEGSDQNMSFGRLRTSGGVDYFQPQASESFGLQNSGPSPIPLLISEIMYHPDVNQYQYLELHNPSGEPLALWHPDAPTQTWGLSGSLSGEREPQFFFPEGTVVPPHAYFICIPESTKPMEAPNGASVFRVPDQIFSTTRGVLRLHRPSGSSGKHLRYLTVDEAIYQNRMPWDPGAAGGGQGLERINMETFGVDPLHWRAGPVGGTPGLSWHRKCLPTINSNAEPAARPSQDLPAAPWTD